MMMLTPRSLKRSSDRAAALIIVLAFVVILTGLAVAYLSRATTDRQLAHTSFHDTAADVVARSVLDSVIGDFRQEIENRPRQINPRHKIYIPIPVRVPQRTVPPKVEISWRISGASIGD
jgi:type II secretory pathway component PulK